MSSFSFIITKKNAEWAGLSVNIAFSETYGFCKHNSFKLNAFPTYICSMYAETQLSFVLGIL